MQPSGKAALAGLALAVLALSASAQPAAEDAPGEFLRIARSEQGAPLSLQSSIVSFGNDSGADSLRVDLVSAIHIADAGYYAELNARFREYDSVLYELVAPEGASVPRGREEGTNVVTRMQLGMRDLLGLSFQLDEIDYAQSNFVHADLTLVEMSQSMQARGESVYQYVWRLFLASLAEASKDPHGVQSAALLVALFSEERERLLKIQLAASMLDIESVTAVLEGENGSTLVGERNRRAVDVLDEEIGRGRRRIAIFYGAAHMPDMARRLESRLGLERTGSVWLDAWDLR